MHPKSVFTLLFCLLSYSSYGQTKAGLSEQLLNAVKRNHLDSVKLLAEQGADVNYQDRHLAPVLMWAAYKGDMEMVKYLVVQGADPTKKGAIYIDTSGSYYGNLMGIGAAEGRLDLLEYLLDSLGIAVDDKGWNPEQNKAIGLTALQWAVISGSLTTCKILLEHNADIDLTHVTDGETPLQLSFIHHQYDICRLLIRNVVNLESANYKGYQVVHGAAIGAPYDIIESLLDKGVNPNARTVREGMSPLMIASYHNNLRVCVLLVESNAQIALEDHNGLTASDYARLGEHVRIQQFLNDPYGLSKYELMNWLELNEEVMRLYLKGQYTEALELGQLCFEKVNSLPMGLKDSCFRTIANNIALCYSKCGSYEKALEYGQISLSLAGEFYGKKDLKYMISLNTLGSIYRSMGNINYSLVYFKEAFYRSYKWLGENHPSFPTRAQNLAGIYMDIGDYNEALGLYILALKNTDSTDIRNYTAGLRNLALCLKRLRVYEGALELLTKSLELSSEAFGTEHNFYGLNLSDLAGVHAEVGNYDKAEELYLEATTVMANALSNAHPEYLGIQIDLCTLLLKKEKFCESSQILIEVNAINKSLIKDYFTYMIEEEKAQNQQEFLVVCSIFQSATMFKAPCIDTLPSIFFNNELTIKDLLLNSTKAMLLQASGRGDSENFGGLKEWRTLRNRLNVEHSLPLNQRSSLPNKWEYTLDSIERELVKHSSTFAKEQQKKEITWQQVQSQLQSNEVAIEFSHFTYYNKKWTDSTLYVAYLLRKDSEYPKMVYLFEEKQLELLAKGTATDALYTRSGGFKAVNQSLHNKGKDLYDLIWKNLEPHLEGIETIYFAPSGKLHQIAFAALADSSGQLLSEKYQLVQMSSTGKLVVPYPEPEKAPALVMGSIQYEYDTTSSTLGDSFVQVYNPVNLVYQSNDTLPRSSRGKTWQYLDGTGKEARSIYRLYRGQKQAVTLVSQTEATEAYVKSLDGNSPKVLHLATHGFFFEDPEDKHEDMGFISNQPVYTLADDPLMRSGLVMAGANYAWQHGQNPYEEEDGILTAYEISNLNLSNTDLVVLSACETGLGDIEGSEGVYGLQRAFRMAGVEYIIMSLWEVPDDETSEFMKLFYKTWLSGDQGIYEAFTHTKRIIAAKYRDEPQKWAGFVLVQ